ncbi:MAG TPA: PQQ-binding-like beta-propeller repeat protein, partial [Bacteroidia bacterium]|nr:PQQ-binding-like beta-propeller repeat protein [Bacteroidia bacterium]
MKRSVSRLLLVLVAGFGPAVWLWIRSREMTHLYWVLPGAALVWLLLFGLHDLAFGQAPAHTRRRRFGVVAAVLLLVGLAGALLLRYEGSSSGSSFPKFAWVWEKPKPITVEEHPTSAGPVSEIAEAVADLPDFLGPNRSGMWPAPAFGTDWHSHPPKLLWRRAIGKGWSSFAVSGTRAFTQEQIGDDEHITCLDLATGATVWTHSDPQTRLLLERAENGGAAMGGDGPRATPVLFQNRVYTMGSTGIANCLAQENGEKLWSRHLLRELGTIAHRWGMANSPLVLPKENLVIFAGPDEPGATLVACDPLSGETR